jgi:hypothetical protein
MTTETQQTLTLTVLTGIVAGSKAGAGMFSFHRAFGPETAPFGAVLAAVGGMHMFARVFRPSGGKRASCPSNACVWEIQ